MWRAETRIDRTLLGGALLAATSLGVPARAQKSPRVGELIEAQIIGDADTPSGHVCRAWLGALAGVVVGTALPAGPRWIDLSGEHPIRVGSLDLHPALRLSLAERRR